MDSASQVQVLDGGVYTSFFTNTLKKGMKQMLLLTDMGKNSMET